MNTNEQITNNEWLLLNAKWAIFQLLYGKNKFHFNEMMMIDVHFVLDQHDLLEFYSANSLKDQSVGRHVAPLGQIILVASQTVFTFTLQCCMLTREAANNYFIVFGMTWQWLEPMIYSIWGEHANHYTTIAVTSEHK